MTVATTHRRHTFQSKARGVDYKIYLIYNIPHLLTFKSEIKNTQDVKRTYINVASNWECIIQNNKYDNIKN